MNRRIIILFAAIAVCAVLLLSLTACKKDSGNKHGTSGAASVIPDVSSSGQQNASGGEENGVNAGDIAGMGDFTDNGSSDAVTSSSGTTQQPAGGSASSGSAASDDEQSQNTPTTDPVTDKNDSGAWNDEGGTTTVVY